MKLHIFLLVLGLLSSLTFAEYCFSDSDCSYDEKCVDGDCVPYDSYYPYGSSSSSSACCCGSSLILLGLLGAIVYNARK